MRAWRYVKGTPGSEPIDVERLDEALDPATALVWVDSDQEPTDEERKHVTTQLGLSPLVVDALANPKPERTKLIQYGDYFHVAVHDCQLAGETLESHEIDIVIGPGWIITVRHPTDATGVPAARRSTRSFAASSCNAPSTAAPRRAFCCGPCSTSSSTGTST